MLQVTGSATYEGGAVGVYVMETYDPADRFGRYRDLRPLLGGCQPWTATFGQVNDEGGEGTIAPNMLNTLTGTIDNFELFPSGGQQEGPNEWAVNLQGDIETGAGTVTSAEGANGGGDPGTLQCHLPRPDGLQSIMTTMTPRRTSTAPQLSVVGEFNANFGNGTAAGAFGARQVADQVNGSGSVRCGPDLLVQTS